MKSSSKTIYKLEVFEKKPSNFDGLLFSFDKEDGVYTIFLSEDPFLAIKEACAEGCGKRCALIADSIDFYADLFISTFELFSLLYLETKDFYKNKVEEFTSKKDTNTDLLEIAMDKSTPIFLIGSGKSLLEDLPNIKEKANCGLIVAAYSSLPYLNDFGIVADVAVSVDPEQKVHEFKNAEVFLSAPKARFSTQLGFKKTAMMPEKFCPFSNYLFSYAPFACCFGHTVVDMTLRYLINHGFHNITLFGVDLEELNPSYPDRQEMGYKLDFRKAKQHIHEIMQDFPSVKMKELKSNEPLSKNLVLKTTHQEIKILEFWDSFEKIKNLDLDNLSLIDNFKLEKEPFYEVVLEPLYEKMKHFDKRAKDNKKSFFQNIISAYKAG
jgi:hypothetical protein